MNFREFISQRTGQPLTVNMDNVTAVAASKVWGSCFIFVVGAKKPLHVQCTWPEMIAEITLP